MARESRPHVRRRPGATGGASRKAQPRHHKVILRLLAKATMAIAACGLSVAFVMWAEPTAYLKKLTDRPIAGVSIEGQFIYVSEQKVQEILVGRITSNFLQLDMVELKRAVEQNPWIDTVSVSRQWPDRLVIRIHEQQPIARWGKDAFVNMRGDIISVDDNSALAHLPLLNSSERYANEVMQKYVQIARLLAPAELGLEAVHLDDTLSWTLRLRGDVVVRVGRDQVFEKLQRLLDVYPTKLAARSEQIASIDLRYNNGFAVGWKDTGLDKVALANK